MVVLDIGVAEAVELAVVDIGVREAVELAVVDIGLGEAVDLVALADVGQVALVVGVADVALEVH